MDRGDEKMKSPILTLCYLLLLIALLDIIFTSLDNAIITWCFEQAPPSEMKYVFEKEKQALFRKYNFSTNVRLEIVDNASLVCKATGAGGCAAPDRVIIDSHTPRFMLVSIIAHELYHVKQFYFDEFSKYNTSEIERQACAYARTRSPVDIEGNIDAKECTKLLFYYLT